MKGIKKQRKTVVAKHIKYFYHPEREGWVCKFCGLKVKKPSPIHIFTYHSEEYDLEQHMIAHKEGKCKCSGSVMEV